MKFNYADNRKRWIFLVEMFHICVSLYYLWLNYWHAVVLYGILTSIYMPPSSYCLAGIQLLTVWGQVLQQAYFFSCSLCFLHKLFDDQRIKYIMSYIHLMRKYLFTLAVFPMSLILSINFWTLYILDSTLYEGNFRFIEKIPSWMNHALHTYIIILVLIEIVINPRIIYPKLKTGIISSCIPLFCYITICHILCTYTNVWVYPLFTRFSNTEKFLYASANIVLYIMAYTVGHYIHKIIWGSKAKIL